MASIIGFPNPVNEVAARAVAAQVLTAVLLTIGLGAFVDTAWLWLTAPLALGFLARVLTGPTLSPFGQLATRVLAPRLGRERLVAGPPKRFAQGIGATLTGLATLLQALGAHTAVIVLLVMVAVAASLESMAGVCVGCSLFALGMRLGLVPDETCAACANIWLREPAER